MAFNFKIDPTGNLISEAKTQAIQQTPTGSRFGMEVDASGNIVANPQAAMVQSGLQQEAARQAERYRSQAGPQTAPTWAEMRDPFTGELRETPESRNLPEMTPISAAGYTDGGLQAVQSIAGSLLAADDDGRKTILKRLIPDIKIEPDSKGNDIITYPDGKQEILNRPGFSRADAIQLAFDTALFLPGGLAAEPVKGAIKKGVVGAIGAGLTETGRQVASGQVGTGEEISPARIAGTAVTGGLAEIPTAVSAVRKGRAASKLGILKEEAKGVRETIAKRQAAAKETGVDLFPAQLTGSGSAARKQAILQKLDGGQRKAYESLNRQDRQIGNAVEDMLDMIAPPNTIDEAPAMFRDAAKKAVDRRLSDRKKAAQKWYNKAFQNEKNVVLPKTHDKIDELRKSFKPDSAGMKFLNDLEKKFGPGNIRQQHSTKEEIDAMFGRFGGDTALDRQQKAILAEIKQEFLKDLKKANKNYDKARKIFSSESPEVDKINKSYLGKVAKMEGYDQDVLDSIVGKVFKPRTTTKQVRQFRKIITKENPKAWDAITRRRLEDLLVKQGYDNPDTFYTAVLKNNAVKKQIKAGLDIKRLKRFEKLEEVIEGARIGRFRGTDTATKIEDVKRVTQGPIARVVEAVSHPIDSFSGWMSGLSKEQRAAVQADVMYNTKWDPDWKALNRVDPQSKKAKSIFTKMMQKAAKPFKAAIVSQSPESPAATRKALEILNKEE